MKFEERKLLKSIPIAIILLILIALLFYNINNFNNISITQEGPTNLRLTEFDTRTYENQETCFAFEVENPEKTNYTVKANGEEIIKEEVPPVENRRIRECIGLDTGNHTVEIEGGNESRLKFHSEKIEIKNHSITGEKKEIGQEIDVKEEEIEIELKNPSYKERAVLIDAGESSQYVKLREKSVKNLVLNYPKDTEEIKIAGETTEIPPYPKRREDNFGLAIVSIILFFFPGLALFYDKEEPVESSARSAAFSFFSLLFIGMIFNLIGTLSYRSIIISWILISAGCLYWRKRPHWKEK